MNREWKLARRPQGVPVPSDYARSETPIPVPAAGEVLLRVLYVAIDPAIRGFMNEAGSYLAAIPLGSPVRGIVWGRVERSESPALAPGSIVCGFGSWSDYVVGPAERFHKVPVQPGRDLAAYTHPLGTIGLTAYWGLVRIARLKPGDTVLVSSAAGAVGSLVGQIARLKGATRVIGIAGGAEKCAKAVRRYGYDACLDYRAGDLSAAIRRALPGGCDVDFENVGGALLQAALDNLAPQARIALCGLIAGYNAAEPVPGPPNLWNLIAKSASIEGFRIGGLLGQEALTAPIFREIDGWIAAGRLAYDVDLRIGFDAIPEAFGCLFTGRHDGRLVVKIADL